MNPIKRYWKGRSHIYQVSRKLPIYYIYIYQTKRQYYLIFIQSKKLVQKLKSLLEDVLKMYDGSQRIGDGTNLMMHNQVIK